MTRLLLLGAVIIWGTTFVASKVCLEWMSPVQLVTMRFALGAPVLFGVARLRGARFDLRPLWRSLTAAAGIFSVHFLIQTWALEHTTATNTGWIVALSPLTIALLAALILKERISRPMVIGIALASAGIVLLVSRGRLQNLEWLTSTGDWLALVSTGTWALYTIVTRDLARARDPVVIALAMTLPLAVLVLVMPFTAGWSPVAALPSNALASLLFLGIAGVALAQWFWQVGIAELGAATAGLFLYLEPLVTTAIAVPYLGEPFGWAGAVGGALVLAGLFVAQRTA